MRTLLLCLTLPLLLPCCLRADNSDLTTMREKATRFLRLTQNTDGSWTENRMVGVTGLVTTSLLRSGLPAEDPLVAAGLQNLLSHNQADGGFYSEGSVHRNYETCITVLALSAANDSGRFDEHIRKAQGFLRDLQWDKGEGIESSDPAFGGGGYGSHQRPDLSNTQFMLEAFRKSGMKKDDPAMQRILMFLSRTQNLEGFGNDTIFAGKIGDGGFYYTPAAGGDSKAGVTENGGLRSYGSMTYAGLKSLIYAGLDKKDERIQAATAWIRKNYTLAENPSMGRQGLYYYFHTFAKTMDVIDEDSFQDAAGNTHDWKAELIERLAELQQPSGKWTNPADRWYEGDPNLVTAYCLMALSHCD